MTPGKVWTGFCALSQGAGEALPQQTLCGGDLGLRSKSGGGVFFYARQGVMSAEPGQRA